MFIVAVLTATFGLPVSAGDTGKGTGRAAKPDPRPWLPSPHYLQGHPPQYFPQPDPSERQGDIIRAILAPDRAAALWLVERIQSARASAQLEKELRRERAAERGR
jgi:hypothetical protein